MRVISLGHAVFAAAMIALGVLGLIKGDFASVWQRVPEGVPMRVALAYFCAIVSLASGIGLLWKRTAPLAARVLLVYVLLWLLLLKAPDVVRAPGVEASWLGCGEIAVMLAGILVIHAWLAGSDKIMCGARVLFGLALIPLGLAHLVYVNETAAMVPAWLPAHKSWAIVTGCTYLMASVAMLIGVLARLAAALTALQMGGFMLLVWMPNITAGAGDGFQWGGTLISLALTAGAWVVADSYRSVASKPQPQPDGIARS